MVSDTVHRKALVLRLGNLNEVFRFEIEKVDPCTINTDFHNGSRFFHHGYKS